MACKGVCIRQFVGLAITTLDEQFYDSYLIYRSHSKEKEREGGAARRRSNCARPLRGVNIRVATARRKNATHALRTRVFNVAAHMCSHLSTLYPCASIFQRTVIAIRKIRPRTAAISQHDVTFCP